MRRHLPLAKRLAWSLQARTPPLVTFDDLFSAASEGLMQAVEGFEPERGLKFHTYAPRRIRGAMLDWLRARDHVPRLVRRQQKTLAAESARFFALYGWPPSADELAAAAPNEFRDARHWPQVESLERQVFAESWRAVEFGDGLVDPRQPTAAAAAGETDFFSEAVRGFNQKERTIILEYYREEKTMKQIAQGLGLSESRVSQMHSDILRVLAKRKERLLEAFA